MAMDDRRAKHGQERIPAKKMREGILAPADSEFGFGEEAAIPASPASGAAFPAFERRYGNRGGHVGSIGVPPVRTIPSEREAQASAAPEDAR
jgi:hypothetical protein